jgi:hypothetical protein
MTEKKVVRAGAPQIAPDLERSDGTVEKILATLDEGVAYGYGGASLIPGTRPVSLLDVLDLSLLHRRDGASS